MTRPQQPPSRLTVLGAALTAAGLMVSLPAAAQQSSANKAEEDPAQTVVIFIVHMPVYNLLLPRVAGWTFWPRAVLMMTVNYVVLALVGALLYRWLKPSALRERVARLAA